MPIREAVSIIVTSDINSSEVYLVERNRELRFFGGYHAFAGGTIDSEDAQITPLNMPRNAAYGPAHIVCGVRELFEETGILMTTGPAISPVQLDHYRRQLLSQKYSFDRILRETQQVIDAAMLTNVCRTLTPEFAPVRYNTYFFAVETKAVPQIWPGELVAGGFYHAGDALQRWRSGEMDIVPPVVTMLEEIDTVGLSEAIPGIHATAQSYLDGRLHKVFWTPGVQMLSLKTAGLPPADYSNTYLVGERDHYIIDPAPTDPAEQTRLWDYLDDEIKRGKRIAGILLSHHHPDHCGAVNACKARYKLPVYAHRATIANLPDIRFSGVLQDGDVLPLGGAPDGRQDWTLTCLHTPGHASGHLIFQENRYGGVFAGDLISMLSTVIINPPDGDMAEYIRSLERLASVAGAAVFPGHGPAVKNGRKVVLSLLEHRRRRERKLLNSLSSEPKTLDQLCAEVYDDVSDDKKDLARRSLFAGLLKLVAEGKCNEVKSGEDTLFSQ